jgi:hypothetical protein
VTHNKIVAGNLNDSVLLKRYRCVLGPGVDLPNVFLDGLLRRDVRHGLVMLVSPLVLFFHPLQPLRVNLVEGSPTDYCTLSDTESLVGTKVREQTVHEFRKTEDPVETLLVDSIILPSLTTHDRNLFLRRRTSLSLTLSFHNKRFIFID